MDSCSADPRSLNHRGANAELRLQVQSDFVPEPGRRERNFWMRRPRPSAFIHTGLTRARGSMFTHFTPADLVAILNIPRLQTLPNSFKILREYRLSVFALAFSRL